MGDSLFDGRRFAVVVFVAALVVAVDVAVLDFFAVESLVGAALMVLTLAVGGYAGLVVVDRALQLDEQ